MRNKFDDFVYWENVIAKAITFLIYSGCCMVQSFLVFVYLLLSEWYVYFQEKWEASREHL
jgi:hypothetical protein